MAVPSQGHYGLHSVRLLTDFVCLYTDEFWLSLCKIVRSLVILLLMVLWFLCSEVNGKIRRKKFKDINK
jgi:L-asparagine transporter-like permease